MSRCFVPIVVSKVALSCVLRYFQCRVFFSFPLIPMSCVVRYFQCRVFFSRPLIPMSCVGRYFQCRVVLSRPLIPMSCVVRYFKCRVVFSRPMSHILVSTIVSNVALLYVVRRFQRPIQNMIFPLVINVF